MLLHRHLTVDFIRKEVEMMRNKGIVGKGVCMVAVLVLALLVITPTVAVAGGVAEGRATARIFDIDDIRELRISVEEWSLVEIVVLNSVDNIRVLNSQGFDFSVEDGVLRIDSPRSSVTVILPNLPNLPNLEDSTPLFDNIHIGGGLANIRIVGLDTHLAQNLTITNPDSLTRIYDVKVSGALHFLSSDFDADFVHLTNVIAGEISGSLP